DPTGAVARHDGRCCARRYRCRVRVGVLLSLDRLWSHAQRQGGSLDGDTPARETGGHLHRRRLARLVRCRPGCAAKGIGQPSPATAALPYAILRRDRARTSRPHDPTMPATSQTTGETNSTNLDSAFHAAAAGHLASERRVWEKDGPSDRTTLR